jgi:hypothetical protein
MSSSFVFQSLIIGTVFLRVPDATSAYFSRGGALFLYVIVFLCRYRVSLSYLPTALFYSLPY